MSETAAPTTYTIEQARAALGQLVDTAAAHRTGVVIITRNGGTVAYLQNAAIHDTTGLPSHGIEAARPILGDLIAAAGQSGRGIVITRRGAPAAVLLSAHGRVDTIQLRDTEDGGLTTADILNRVDQCTVASFDILGAEFKPAVVSRAIALTSIALFRTLTAEGIRWNPEDETAFALPGSDFDEPEDVLDVMDRITTEETLAGIVHTAVTAAVRQTI